MFQNIEHTCPVVYTRDQRLLVTLIGFRKGDPIKRLIRDGVLSEKQAQLGRMFGGHGVDCRGATPES